jgi:hypothetical protein
LAHAVAETNQDLKQRQSFKDRDFCSPPEITRFSPGASRAD